jgi:flagellar L-ring protein FlgH
VPTLVKRDARVLMLAEGPSLSLTAEGRALESGASGEHIRVLNPTSRAVLDAVVIGEGRVRMDPQAPPLTPAGGERTRARSTRDEPFPIGPGAAPGPRRLQQPATALRGGAPAHPGADRRPDPRAGVAPRHHAHAGAAGAPVEGESLWRPGSRAFFKDQRAARVGDLVTVLVSMNDQATLKNATTATRNSAEAAGVPNLFGLETLMIRVPMDPNKLLSINSSNSNVGAGQIQRSETVTLRLAGVVTQVLPNGNLVVMAHEQFRADNELRDLKVSGVIRPEDIASDNTVRSDRMAEARIAYDGRGELTDVQAPRWGQQVLDVVLPF